MGGGPSTPELAAAVSAAGGLGFLAAGYRTPDALVEQIGLVRARTAEPFGVNVFVPGHEQIDQSALDRYLATLQPEAARYGTELGKPRADDDAYDAKLRVIGDARPAVVSFTFGAPSAGVVEDLQRAGAAVWITVTDVDEARRSAALGADALVIQGTEAGAHRGSWTDRERADDYGLLALLRLVAGAVDLPLVASGGLSDGRAVAAVLVAGAAAAQLGTAFLRTPEAGTSPAHRAALTEFNRTAVTRAFTGRRARGLVNRFLSEHSAAAPSAYPNLHHVTAPLRAAARERGDADGLNLWAGQGHSLVRELPAGELVRTLGAEARAAVSALPPVLLRDRQRPPPGREADG